MNVTKVSRTTQVKNPVSLAATVYATARTVVGVLIIYWFMDVAWNPDTQFYLWVGSALYALGHLSGQLSVKSFDVVTTSEWGSES